MIRNYSQLTNIFNRLHLNKLNVRLQSSSNINIEKLESESSVEVIDDEVFQREEEIERKRNKSRLKEHDRRFLLEQNPYPEPNFWHHGTLKYMRRLYGRYGTESGVDPSICWPVKQELQESKEYEQVAYPFKIEEMVKMAQMKRAEKEKNVQDRQDQIVKKMEKLDQWKQEFYERINRKEKEALAARERKERLIEEVRQHFGYTVDPKDERFVEMLAKKEKEQRKAMKEAKRQANEAKMVDRLLKKKGKVESLEEGESAEVKEK